MDTSTIEVMLKHYRRRLSAVQQRIAELDKERTDLTLDECTYHVIIERLTEVLPGDTIPQSDFCGPEPCVK